MGMTRHAARASVFGEALRHLPEHLHPRAVVLAAGAEVEGDAVEDESDTPRVPLVACTRKSDEDVFGLLQARVSAQFRAQFGAIL